MGFVRKHTADALTFARVVLGVLLVLFGLVDGKAALAQDVWLLVAAWSTDMVDGRISRSLKTAEKTWLGKNDVYVDMGFSLAVLAYLAVTGLVSIGIVLGYLLVWGVVLLRFGFPPLAAQVFQNPIYACFVFLTVKAAPAVLPWLLLWAGIALVVFWRRAVELFKSAMNTIRFC